jgi:hypothetical protein
MLPAFRLPNLARPTGPIRLFFLRKLQTHRRRQPQKRKSCPESLTKLTELGFDVRQGSHCTATSPHFVVVTSDNVTHVLTGCAKGSAQTPPAAGWIRVRFDPANPAQANPAIPGGQQIKSIAVVLDEGPEATAKLGGGLVVLDNIEVNGVVIDKD